MGPVAGKEPACLDAGGRGASQKDPPLLSHCWSGSRATGGAGGAQGQRVRIAAGGLSPTLLPCAAKSRAHLGPELPTSPGHCRSHCRLSRGPLVLGMAAGCSGTAMTTAAPGLPAPAIWLRTALPGSRSKLKFSTPAVRLCFRKAFARRGGERQRGQAWLIGGTGYLKGMKRPG